MHAPSRRARRLLIAVLAFALAVGFAFVALTGPVDAKDAKNYEVTVAPPEVGTGSTTPFTVTFTNPTSNTATQKAGSFSIDFGSAGFSVNSVTGLSASGGQSWEVVSTSNGKVVVSAVSGGDRISVTQTVQFVVNATAPSSPGLRTLVTDGDQEDHGDFRGGNRFTLMGPPATVNVVSMATTCTDGNCGLNGEGWNASLQCDEPCSYLVNPNNGFVADVTVNSDGTVYMVLTTTGKGPAPGSAFVEADGVRLPSCGTNGPPKCVHIQRVGGNHTQYEVFWSGDPRFKFG